MDGPSTMLQHYNAAVDLIERNLAARPDKIAYIDEHGSDSESFRQRKSHHGHR